MAMLGSIAGVKQNIVICRLTIGVQGFGKVGLFDIALADMPLFARCCIVWTWSQAASSAGKQRGCSEQRALHVRPDAGGGTLMSRILFRSAAMVDTGELHERRMLVNVLMRCYTATCIRKNR